MDEAIKQALLTFHWSNYRFDELEELAEDDPDVGIFDALAAHIRDGIKNDSCGCV